MQTIGEESIIAVDIPVALVALPEVAIATPPCLTPGKHGHGLCLAWHQHVMHRY
jgi:hypothetical protein